MATEAVDEEGPNEMAVDTMKLAEEEEDEIELDPEDSPNYGEAAYWDERYTLCPNPFDWYQEWDSLDRVLGPFFDGSEIVLNVGCGNSRMAIEMGKKFSTVVNIDISSVVIERMEEENRSSENLLWFVMDCMDMSFDDEMFDIAFDKGTFDALLCGPDSIRKVRQTCLEIYRVLGPGGLFFEITYGSPSSRVSMFENFEIPWKMHSPIPILNPSRGQSVHWIYIFEKLPEEVKRKPLSRSQSWPGLLSSKGNG
jgi:ubiquinone/menaquinone biosynthesis C-methylase UbiE